jgi:thymidylate synthase
MRQYLELCRHVLECGADKPDRTGTGTRSVFGWQMRFDLGNGFPLLTTKRLNTKAIVHEFVHALGDAHIYRNHLGQVEVQLAREPRTLPSLALNHSVKDLFGFRFQDVRFEGYDPHPRLRGDIAL